MMQQATEKYQYPSVKIKGSGKPIENIGRIQRVLKLIRLLNEPRTLTEIAKELDMSKKSAQRYIKLIVDLDMNVEKTPGFRPLYKLVNVAEFFNVGQNRR